MSGYYLARRQNLTYSRISCKRKEEAEEEDCADHFCGFVESKNNCTPRYTSFSPIIARYDGQ